MRRLIRGLSSFATVLLPVWLGIIGDPWILVAMCAGAISLISVGTAARMPVDIERAGSRGILFVWGIAFAIILAFETAIWAVAALLAR